MPVLYVNLHKNESTQNEPYLSFFKKFDLIKEDLNGERIELRVGGKDGKVYNGFFTDEIFYKNPRLTLDFATLPLGETVGEKGTFIRMTYSYDVEDTCDLDFHIQRVKDIRKRAPYYYLPDVTHFDFSSQIDETCQLFFDVVVAKEETVKEVCCSLIGLLIAIFSLDN